MPKFAVSMIGMKRPAASRECLETMLARSSDAHYFVTANGCQETARQFREVAAKHSNVTVHENGSNLGFQIPHHRQFVLASQMGCQYCLIANDDITVPEGFLDTLAAPMDADKGIAITGPEGTCAYLDHDFHGTGGTGEPEYIEGSCSMFRIDALRKHRSTLWCDGLSFVYSEDSSASLYLREKGYRIRTVPMHLEHARSVTVNGDPETKRLCQEAQAKNHEVNRKRWSYYLSRRTFDFPIVIRRWYALGDVLLVTPIVRALAESNPLSPIYIETQVPSLLEGNPYIRGGAESIPKMDKEMRINLDMAYEHRPGMHIVDAYAEEVRKHLPGLGDVEHRTEFALSSPVPREERLVVLHDGPCNWPGKKWPHFEALKTQLRVTGWRVEMMEKWGKFSGAAAQIARASLFIGIDSFPMHLALSVGTPTVGIFGITRARYIMTNGSPHVAVESSESIASSGARHRQGGLTFLPGGDDAMASISVENVMEGVKKLGL